MALAMLASPAAAQESGSEWQFYQDDEATKGLLQAFVGTEDGTQLIIKCDEAGKRKTFAVFVAPVNLVAPSSREQSRDIVISFDDGPSRKERWRYFYQTARAVNTPGEGSLKKFLSQLNDAKTISVRFDALDGLTEATTFRVEGAREAVQHVFDSCKDENPAA